MSAMYDRHEVSVKVALYSNDSKRVLLMYYPHDDGFGLPGGHIDAGETSDVALERELREELGITIDATPADFYMRYPRGSAVEDHKIILGYTAIADGSIKIPSRACDGGEERPIWLAQAEIETTDKLAPGYRDFVLRWWPQEA